MKPISANRSKYKPFDKSKFMLGAMLALVLGLIFQVAPLNVSEAYAASTPNVSFAIQTDKQEYTTGESAHVVLDIAHNSGDTINEVQYQVVVPEGFDGSQVKLNGAVGTMHPGDAQRIELDIPTDTRVGKTTVAGFFESVLVPTGDNALFWSIPLVLLALGVVGVIFLVRKKHLKKRRLFAATLSVLLAVSLTGVTGLAGSAIAFADTAKTTQIASNSILLDGEKKSLQANLSYSIAVLGGEGDSGNSNDNIPKGITYKDNAIALDYPEASNYDPISNTATIADGIAVQVGDVVVIKPGLVNDEYIGGAIKVKEIADNQSPRTIKGDNVPLEEYVKSINTTDAPSKYLCFIPAKGVEYNGAKERLSGLRQAFGANIEFGTDDFSIKVNDVPDGISFDIGVKTDHKESNVGKLDIESEVEVNVHGELYPDFRPDIKLLPDGVFDSYYPHVGIINRSRVVASGGLSKKISVDIPVAAPGSVPLGIIRQLSHDMIDIEIGVYFRISLEGSLSIGYEVLMDDRCGIACIDGQVQPYRFCNDTQNKASFEATAEANLGFLPKIKLRIGNADGGTLIDTEVFIGVKAGGEYTARIVDGQELTACLDLCAQAAVEFSFETDFWPIAILMKVLGKEEEDGKVQYQVVLVGEDGLTKFEFCRLHIEDSQIVPECTWKEVQPDAPNPDQPTDDNKDNWITYTTATSSDCPVFEFDYPKDWALTETKGDGFLSDLVVSIYPDGKVDNSASRITLNYLKAFPIGNGVPQIRDFDYLEVENAQFDPVSFNGKSYSHLGEFCVAKATYTGFASGRQDYYPIVGDPYVCLELIPKLWLTNKNTEWHYYPYQSLGMWCYGSDKSGGVRFSFSSPDGSLPAEYYDDAVKVLASLRVADKDKSTNPVFPALLFNAIPKI